MAPSEKPRLGYAASLFARDPPLQRSCPRQRTLLIVVRTGESRLTPAMAAPTVEHERSSLVTTEKIQPQNEVPRASPNPTDVAPRLALRVLGW